MKRLLVLAVILLGACRGQPSEKPPLYIFPDMDWQPKIQGQEAWSFYPDGRGNRPPVDGTVARGHLDEDDAYFRGRVGDMYVAKAPIQVDEKVIRRGQERFNIYCTPCHDKTGSGKGMAVRRGFPPPVDLTGDRVRGLSDGEIFNVISHGVRNMPGYGYQVPVADRWAIITWVRVLGRSQHASVQDVPADKRGTIEASAP